MSRLQMIHKLGNAIREYRGAYKANSGIWYRHPRKSARPRVIRWMSELGIETEAGIIEIDGFKTFKEMETWMKKI